MEKAETRGIINTEKIERGEFRDIIPEFYELEGTIENNDWHNNDSTFNHTLAALKSLEKVLEEVKEDVSDYLSQKVSNYTRKDLLRLSTLFHDIAKKETVIKNGDKTSFPKHDNKGAVKAGKILFRFDLSENERNLVCEITKHHLIIQEILKPFRSSPNEGIYEVKKKYPNMFWELILIGYADTLGCQPNQNVIDEFNARVKFYKQVLF